jgi:hypothetical protein
MSIGCDGTLGLRMAKSQQRDDVVGTMPRITFTLCMRSVSRASGGTEYQPGMGVQPNTRCLPKIDAGRCPWSSCGNSTCVMG